MNCYKCGSDKELSAKKIDSHGNITFMCKPCRKEARTSNKNSQYTKSATVSKEWVALAKERNSRLINKYLDTKFLEARTQETI